jgi:glycosyltransferase involved in cell wall biosynthesis
MDRKICLVSWPIKKPFTIPLTNLERILSRYSKDLYLILGCYEKISLDYSLYNKCSIIPVNNSDKFSVRAINYVLLQFKVAIEILRNLDKIDDCFFFMDIGPLLPMVVLKLFKKKIIWMLPAAIHYKEKSNIDYGIKVMYVVQPLCYHLADDIIVYSPNLIDEWYLTDHKNKIKIAREHQVDITKFNITDSYAGRDLTIGYVGRLSVEKGIISFIHSINNIHERYPDAKFLIAGTGPLKQDIEIYVKNNHLSDIVQVIDWVNHDDLPDVYNKLKLIIVPSYTEGLPNVMLEAMACGVPVVATPVGAIIDVIADGETGFLLQNNSPEHITEKVVRILKYSDLCTISDNARKQIEDRFTYEKAIERFVTIFAR